ncbi:MAG TPA: hypothetical protein VF407_01220 [Polyangiaceae bacterium]
MPAPAKKAPERAPLEDLDDWLDSVDVPAAVVCARCGSADCAGCAAATDKSGFISLVAWERTEGPVLERLWATARATTRDPDHFFEALPQGPIAPALRFAVLAELVAATAMTLVVIAMVACFAPGFVWHSIVDAAARSIALRAIFAGIPVLAALLVGAHVAHGVALDIGTPKEKRFRGSRTHALRFGLYATGWDVVLGPIGAVVVLAKEGAEGLRDVSDKAMSLPGRSARAFLRGVYGLHGEEATRPLRLGVAASFFVTGLAVAFTIVVICALLLF